MENDIVAIWLWNREVGRIYWDDASCRACVPEPIATRIAQYINTRIGLI